MTMEDNQGLGPAKVIRRYPNRKMYDTDTSSYVNLDELASMIREGIDIEVVDYKSGEDVTGMVMAQILYEEERKKEKSVPADLMKRIVRFGEENLGTWVGRVFPGTPPEHPLQAVREEVEEQVKKLVEKGQLTREEANRFLRDWMDTTTQNIDQWQKKVDDRAVEVFDRVTGLPSLRTDVEELLSRLDLMEKRMDVVEDRLRRALRSLDDGDAGP